MEHSTTANFDFQGAANKAHAEALKGYLPCAYFNLETRVLSWEKPEGSYIEVNCPSELSCFVYHDFKVGDILVHKDGFRFNQLLMLWQSINMYKIDYGSKLRGQEGTGTLDFLTENYKVVLTAEEVFTFFKGQGYGGWVPVHKQLPPCWYNDRAEGTRYRCLHMDGTRTFTRVKNSAEWEAYAAFDKVTHWWDPFDYPQKERDGETESV